MDWRIVFVLLLVFNFTLCKKPKCNESSNTCSDCIVSRTGCAWCAEPMLNITVARCQLKESFIKQGSCQQQHIISPANHKLKILKEKPVTKRRLISPQRLTLALRKGAQIEIPLSVYAVKEDFTIQCRYPRQVRIKMSVIGNCQNGTTFKNKLFTCKGIPSGKVKLKLHITMKRCLSKPKKIKLIIDGNRKKSLKISLKSRCKCDCEKPMFVVRESVQCSSHGQLTCGACQCDRERYGPHCECQGIMEGSTDSHCRISNSTEVCSGRGACKCGYCECTQRGSRRYTGQFCECDDYSCGFDNGELCGGPSRGKCVCGACMCRAGHSGEVCNMATDTNNCKTPWSRKICSGHGRCVNNRCLCEREFAGRLCEDCPTCPGACRRLNPCVQCVVFQSGPITRDDCSQNCSYLEFFMVDDVVVQDQLRTDRYKLCRLGDPDGCMTMFSYNDQSSKIKVNAQITKQCPNSGSAK